MTGLILLSIGLVALTGALCTVIYTRLNSSGKQCQLAPRPAKSY